MASPITEIQKETKTEEQLKAEKLEELKTLFAENEEAVAKTMSIMAELNSLGIFDAAGYMLQAKEEIAKIALGQISGTCHQSPEYDDGRGRRAVKS